MFNCKKLSWLDLSHNYLTALSPVNSFLCYPDLLFPNRNFKTSLNWELLTFTAIIFTIWMSSERSSLLRLWSLWLFTEILWIWSPASDYTLLVFCLNCKSWILCWSVRRRKIMLMCLSTPSIILNSPRLILRKSLSHLSWFKISKMINLNKANFFTALLNNNCMRQDDESCYCYGFVLRSLWCISQLSQFFWIAILSLFL